MVDRIRKKLCEILLHWGFGNIEADISATIATNKELTAQEISNEVGCAYSTTINSLNQLRRIGYINRSRHNRKYVYSFNADFISIISDNMQKLGQMLQDLSDEIHQARGKYKYRITDLALKVDNTLEFLKNTKMKGDGL